MPAGSACGRGPHPRSACPRESNPSATTSSETCRGPSSSLNAPSASPVTAVSASSGAVRPETLSATVFLTAAPSRSRRFWLNIRTTMRAVGLSLRTSSAVETFTRSSLVTMTTAAGLLHAGRFKHLGAAAIALHGAHAGESRIVGRGVQIDDDDRQSRGADRIQHAPPDASQPAQHDRPFHPAPLSDCEWSGSPRIMESAAVAHHVIRTARDELGR